MKSLLSIFAILFFYSSCSNSVRVLEKDTSFGGKFYLHNDVDSRLLHIDLIFNNVGANLDPKNLAGLSDITSTLLDAGNSKFNKKEFQNFLDGQGIEYTYKMERFYTKFSFVCLKEKEKELFYALNLMFNDANFPQSEINKELSTRVGGIYASMSDDEFLVKYYSDKNFFKGQLSMPLDGTVSSFKNISRKDILYFYRNYFVKENLSISVLAKIDDLFLKRLYKFTSELKSGVTAKDIKYYTYTHGKNLLFVDKKGARENQVFIKYPLKDLSFRNDKITWLDLFTNIFSLGMDSRLFTVIRKKYGYAYGVGGTWKNQDRKHLYYEISYNPQNGVLVESINKTLELVYDVKTKGVERINFERKKEYLANLFLYKLSTKHNILTRYVMHQILNFNPDYDNTYLERLSKIDFKKLNKFISHTLNTDDVFITVIGDINLIKKEKGFKELSELFNTKYIDYRDILND